MALLCCPSRADLLPPPIKSSPPSSIFATLIFLMLPLILDFVENTENMTEIVAKKEFEEEKERKSS